MSTRVIVPHKDGFHMKLELRYDNPSSSYHGEEDERLTSDG